MRINLFDAIFCIFMRYKYAILGVIVSIFLTLFTNIKGITFIPFCMVILLLNYLCNSAILFNGIKYKCGHFKVEMYNKYKDILNFKCTLIYDEDNLEYHYIKFDDTQYYISNIYLFVFKTYRKKNFLEYEKIRSNNLIFIASSKAEVAEHFYECIEVKVRNMNADIMKMEKMTERYCDLAKEVEYHKYSN